MKTPKNVTIDSVAIRRRIEGWHRIELTEPERHRAIRILNRRGLNDTDIAATLGYTDDYVGKHRRRMKLPKNTAVGTRRLVHA